MWLSKKIYSDDIAKGWIPWGLFAPLLSMFFILGAVLPIDTLLTNAGFIDKDGTFTGVIGFIIFLFSAFSILAGIIVLWVKYIERRSLCTIGISGHKPIITLWKGHLLGIVMSGLIVLIITLLGGYKLGEVFPSFFSPTNLIAILILFFGFTLQSGAEEMLFRGWLFSVVTRKFNLVIGMLFSAGVFTLLHYTPDPPWYVHINSFLFSIFACYLVLITGTLWLAIGFHAGWNWFIGTGFEIPITGIDLDIRALVAQLTPNEEVWLTGGSNGPENSVICFFTLLLGIIFCQIKLNQKNNRVLDVDIKTDSNVYS